MGATALKIVMPKSTTPILMGVCFLTLLLFAEFLLGTTLFGRTVVEQGKAITSSAGLCDHRVTGG
jgi:hypothetical protein